MKFTCAALMCLAPTAVVTARSSAQASDPQPARFELEWKVEGDCLDREGARAAIERSLRMRGLVAEPAVVRVTIARRPDGAWGADIWMYGVHGSGERSFEGTSCAQVAEAATLIVAMALDEAAPATTEKPQQRTARHVRPGSGVELGLRAAGDIGSLPAPTLGLGLLLAIPHGVLRVELEATAWLPRSARGGPVDGSGGEFGLYTAGLRGCVDVLRVEPAGLRLGPCLGVEAGTASGAGIGVAESETSGNFWSAGSIGLSARYRANGALGFGFSVGLGVPFRRPTWHIDELDVFRPAALLVRASLHVAWLLP